MQKSTEQAPNPPITRSDIFGADDTSDENETHDACTIVLSESVTVSKSRDSGPDFQAASLSVT